MKIGTNNIEKVYLGTAEITSIFLGSSQVYSGDTPTPPTPSYETSLEYRYIPSYNVSATVLTTYGVVGEYAKYNGEDNHNVNANANPTSAQQFMTQLYSSSNVISNIPSSQGNFYVSKLFKAYSNYKGEDLYVAGSEDNGWVSTFRPFDMGNVDSVDENGNAVEFNPNIHSNMFSAFLSKLDGTRIATYDASAYDTCGIGTWSVGDSIYFSASGGGGNWECYLSMSNLADDSDWGSATETHIDTLCRNAGLNDGDVFKVEIMFYGMND